MKITRHAARWGYAAATVLALGFGAAQAAAAPAREDGAPTCKPKQCDRDCRAQGGIQGRCNNGQCLCLF